MSMISLVSKNVGVTLIIAAVSGCATTPTYIRYINPKSTQEQFMKDRYACYIETQQRVSSAYANQYGGAASSQVIPSCSAIGACLAARGYYRSDTTDRAELGRPGTISEAAAKRR